MKSLWICFAFSLFACSVQAQSILEAPSTRLTAAEQWGLQRAQDGSFSALSRGAWHDAAASRYEDDRGRRQPWAGWSRDDDFDRDGDDRGGGDDDDRGPISAVPEPSSLVLLASGAAVALMGSTRRRWRDSK